jgi:hypothetical protein
MKFAVIIAYELRGIKKTIESYYKHIIDFYNADVFIICQKQFDDDEERLKLFNRRVKLVKLYQKPIVKEYFGENNIINIESQENWNNPGVSQMYINQNEISKIIKDYVNDYDYFIQFRTDIDILFNFPQPELFEKIPPGIFTFWPKYCEKWGGSGGANYIHKKFVVDYFKSCFDLMNNDLFINFIRMRGPRGINQEFIHNQAFILKGLKLNLIKNINYYYTAEKMNDYTTWAFIQLHPKYNVICKYPEQCDEAHEALELWKNNYKWDVVNNEIVLINKAISKVVPLFVLSNMANR